MEKVYEEFMEAEYEAFEIIEDICTLIVERSAGKFSKDMHYTIKVVYNEETIYRNRLSIKEWVIYNRFIRERLVVLLQDCGKLDKDYAMIEIGNRMYRVSDTDYVDSHRCLKRQLESCDYAVEEPFTMDLVLGCTMYDGFTHPKNELVFRFDNFYLNGCKVGTLSDLEIFAITRSDLEYDCPKIVRDYFERNLDFKITSYVGPSCEAYYE